MATALPDSWSCFKYETRQCTYSFQHTVQHLVKACLPRPAQQNFLQCLNYGVTEKFNFMSLLINYHGKCGCPWMFRGCWSGRRRRLTSCFPKSDFFFFIPDPRLLWNSLSQSMGMLFVRLRVQGLGGIFDFYLPFLYTASNALANYFCFTFRIYLEFSYSPPLPRAPTPRFRYHHPLPSDPLVCIDRLKPPLASRFPQGGSLSLYRGPL